MNLQDLRKLAEAATPGPWKAGSDWVTADPEFNSVLLQLTNTNSAADGWDLEYIAAANPATIIHLLDLIAQCKEALIEVSNSNSLVDDVIAAIEQWEKK